MFNNQKFLTRGVMAEIPSWLTNLMWHMVLTMEVEKKDYLQVFTLTKTPTGQHIVHEQEQPPYRYELDVPVSYTHLDVYKRQGIGIAEMSR